MSGLPSIYPKLAMNDSDEEPSPLSALLASKGRTARFPSSSSSAATSKPRRNSHSTSQPSHSQPPPSQNQPPSDSGKARISSSKLAELEDELAHAKDELLRRDEYVQGMQRNYLTLANLCSENLAEMERLKGKVADLSSQLQMSQEKLAKADKVKTQTNSQHAEMAALKAKISESEAEIRRVSQHHASLQRQLNTLHTAHTTANTQLAKAHNLANARQEELEEMRRLASQDESKHLLKEEKQKCVALQQQLREMLSEHDRLEEEVQDKQVQLQKALNQLRRAELDREDAVCEAERAQTRQQQAHTEAQQALDQLAQQTQHSDQSSVESRRLSAERSALQRANQQLSQRISDVEGERDRLQQTLNKLEASSRDDLARHLQQTRLQQTVALSEKEGLGQHIQLLLDQHQSLSQHKLALESSLSQRDAQLTQAIQHNDTMQHRIQELEVELAALKAKQAEWTNKGASSDAEAKAEAELATARQRIDRLERQNGDRTAELLDLRKAKQQLLSQTQDLEVRLAAMEARAQQAEHTAHTVTQAAADKADLEHSMRRLQRQLMDEQKANEELRRLPRLGQADVDRLRSVEAELQVAIAKLIVSEDASEAAFTCMSCMNLYTDPVTCVPCGHSYCARCLANGGGACEQCGPDIEGQVDAHPNPVLAGLAAKFVFRKQALASLKQMASFTFTLPSTS